MYFVRMLAAFVLVFGLNGQVKASNLRDDVRPEPSPVLKIANKVLNDKVSDRERAHLIRSNPEYAADLLQTLVADIEPGTKEENARIPLLWEVSVFAAEKNNREIMARILDISIPKNNATVHNWQIAVIGGGLIFELSKNGKDPRNVIGEMVESDPLLNQRWQSLVRVSRKIVMDESQSLGIRYDALRIFAMSDWSVAKNVYQQLFSKKVVTDESDKALRLAAVTAIPDFNKDETTEFFVNRFSLLSFSEREKVCRVLSKNERSATRLLQSLRSGIISPQQFPRRAIQCFRANASERVRRMAASIF